MSTIYTIGHSTHTAEHFLAMLQSFGIRTLADIRKLPGSNSYPHFNKESLSSYLAAAGITYLHFPELGGRRKPLPDSHNTAWRNKAFMGYADYMETDEFKAAIARLQELAAAGPLAYMCSEAVWWRCHRALVSDYLKAGGWQVMHITDANKAKEHPYTGPAQVQQGRLFYN